MNMTNIQTLILQKTQLVQYAIDDVQLQPLQPFLQHAPIRDYLTQCLPVDTYIASGIRVHPLARLLDEHAPDTTPGGYLFSYGYLVIATTVGGNAICIHGATNMVYWGNHDNFFEGFIMYRDRTTGDWHEGAMTEANISHVLIPLANDLVLFLYELLQDKLTNQLDRLD